MELNKIYHLFLTDCFFLSTEFTIVLFKWDFNSYAKCMKTFFPKSHWTQSTIHGFDVLFLIMQDCIKKIMIIKMQI